MLRGADHLAEARLALTELECLCHQRERDVRLELGRSPGERPEPAGRGLVERRRYQRRLADPRFSGDVERSALAFAERVERGAERLELRIAAYEPWFGIAWLGDRAILRFARV
jgi:hypothetical protein